MTPLRTLSLCTGVGGLDLGADMVTPVELVAYAENGRYPARVMEHHFPDVPNLGDLRAIVMDELDALDPVDLLTAGYPCQPFSVSGRRKGVEDERHLYPHVGTCIRALRPRLILLENVTGHLSQGFAEVVGDLSQIGYRVAWTCLRASEVGAPHSRERLFVLAADTRSKRPLPHRVGSLGPSTSVSINPRSAVPTFDYAEYGPAIRRWERVTGRVAPYPFTRGARGGRRTSPAWGEWIMGLPAGWLSDLPRSELPVLEATHIFGNAVVPLQAAHAFASLLDVHAKCEGVSA